MKKILSIILAAALSLSLTACGKTATGGAITSAAAGSTAQVGTTPMGRWVETEIELSENLYISDMSVQNSGDIWVFAVWSDSSAQNPTSKLRKFVSKDNGKTWIEESIAWAETTDGQIARAVATASGTVLFQSYKKIGEEVATELWMQKQAEEPTKLEFAEFTPGYNLSFFRLLSEDVIALGRQEGKDGEIDIQFALFNTVTKEKIIDIKDTEGYLLGESYYEDSAYYVQLTPGGNSYANTLKKLSPNGNIETMYADIGNVRQSDMDDKGNFYFVNENGISRLAKDGSIVENVINGSSFALGIPDVYPQSLCVLPNGDFVVGIAKTIEAGAKLYLYHFDESIPAANANTLEVWSLNDNHTLRMAIVEFGKMNSDITINYTVGMPKDASGLNKNDVISTLNTEILAGSGPDILVFDGMDASPYANKGLLVDLASSIDKASLAQNIAEPFYQDGKVFVLPARFTAPIIMGKTGEVEKCTSLQALQTAILALPPRPDINTADEAYYAKIEENQKYAMSFLDAEDLLNFILDSSAGAVIKDGVIDTNAVEKIFTFIKAISDHNGMANYRDDQMRNGIAFTTDSGEYIELLDGGYEYTLTHQASYARTIMKTIGALSEIGYKNDGENEYASINAVVQPGLCEGAFIPTCLVGVSANSMQQEAALQFAQSLFSESAQNTASVDGMPVLQSALSESIKRNTFGTQEMNGFTGDAKALINSLKTPILIDPVIKEKLLPHAKALCKGTESIEAAVQGVTDDLALYIAEKA